MNWVIASSWQSLWGGKVFQLMNLAFQELQVQEQNGPVINRSIKQSIELLLVVSYMFLINSPNNWIGRRCWSCHLVNYYYICRFAKIVIRENDVLFHQLMWCKNRMTPKKKNYFLFVMDDHNMCRADLSRSVVIRECNTFKGERPRPGCGNAYPST